MFMPKLIGYSRTSSLNSLISWLHRNKPNIKYSLKAEYVKNGRKYEADCGSISGDPIISILYYILSNSIYSSGKGVTNPSVAVYTTANGTTNVNALTSWESTSYTIDLLTYGAFSLNFSTAISSVVTSATTVSSLVISFNYGQNSSGTPYSFSLAINTQGGTACNISVTSNNIVSWTLSGTVNDISSNATSSWYVVLWNEIWAEFIASTGVSGAPTNLFTYPSAGTALFKEYVIGLTSSSGSTLGSYNSSTGSGTAISNPSLSPGSSSGLSSTPYVSFVFTPTSSATLQTIVTNVYLNGTSSTSGSTALAAGGFLQLGVNNLNVNVGSGDRFSIILTDNISVTGNT